VVERAGEDRPPGDAALEVVGVSFGYTRAVRALNGVGFTVPYGGFTALLGPNGAGKTTLMALITRLFVPEAGTIRVCGHALRQSPLAALAAMGVVFQRPTLDLDLTVMQDLRYAAALHGLGGAAARARIDELLARLDLAERALSRVRTLSGGLRRRVEIARALLHRPRLLILDEATVGLDIDSRQSLVAHVHELCARHGLAVLWATHLIDEIWPGDRVVLLHRGEVRAAGTSEEVIGAAGGGTLAEAYRRLTMLRTA
jgi:ABC-2 type transport system ATP-binding protein